MRRRHQYYTLIASLPPLPYFERAERLPINQERLAERLRMLEPEDAEVVERTSAFLAWDRQPVTRTDRDLVADYQRLMALIDQTPLMRLIGFGIDLRTIMAALRRRQRGLPLPAGGEPWGVGQWVRHIERYWDDPHFKLVAVYPWITQVREYLAGGEILALEQLLMKLIWEQADRFALGNEFGFDAVLAYIFKWNILQRWLAYDYQAAKIRFDELLAEVTDAHERLLDFPT